MGARGRIPALPEPDVPDAPQCVERYASCGSSSQEPLEVLPEQIQKRKVGAAGAGDGLAHLRKVRSTRRILTDTSKHKAMSYGRMK